jgi:hypothetical protein
MIKRAEAFERAAKILRAQVSHRSASRIWQKSVSDRGVGNDVINLVSDVQWFEETGRKRGTTWGEGKDKVQKRRVQNTMGYVVTDTTRLDV